MVLLTIAAVALGKALKVMEPLGADVWWKVIGYAGIPLVMAWAGVHLAADVIKRQKIKRMFKALFVCLAALGILIVAVVEQKSDKQHKEEVRYQRTQYEYQRDQNTSMAQKLETGQAAATSLALEVKDLRKDLTSFLSNRSPASAGPTTQPAISAAEIANLEQRALNAERSAQQLSELYTLENKRQSWPYGAAGANYPGLHAFFLKNLPEGKDLNGEDRFFIYYMMKHNCEVDWSPTGRTELSNLLTKEFSAYGLPFMEILHRLEDHGFVLSDPRFGTLARLKEPYCSRIKNIQIP